MSGFFPPGCKDSCTETQHRPNAAPVFQISRVSYTHTCVFGPCCVLSIVHPNILELILISSWPHHLTYHFLLSFRYRIVTPHILTTLLQDVKIIGSLISSQTYFRYIINKLISHVSAGSVPARLRVLCHHCRERSGVAASGASGSGSRNIQWNPVPGPSCKSRCKASGLLFCSVTDNLF